MSQRRTESKVMECSMQFTGERLRAYIAWKLQDIFEFTISTPTGRFSPVGFFVFTHNG